MYFPSLCVLLLCVEGKTRDKRQEKSLSKTMKSNQEITQFKVKER